MSRIGKQPIEVPKGVKATIAGSLIKVEGPKGNLERTVRPEVTVRLDDGHLVVERNDESKEARAFHGMERALLSNMVKGVSQGFEKELQLIGVGYKAEISNQKLNLALGYSHTIDYELPAGIKGQVVREGRELSVKIEGIDKQLVGQVAAELRGLRPPEPYKGKGVRYKGEVVRTKVGKSSKK